MTIFVVETCMVKPDKIEAFKLLMERVRKYKEEKPEMFEEVKSWKLYKQMFGCGIAGAYVSIWEYESLTDLDKNWAKEYDNKEFMKMHEELMQIIDPATFHIEVWSSAT